MGTTESLSVPDRWENLSSSVQPTLGRGGGSEGLIRGTDFFSSKYVVMAKILPQIIT